MRGSWGWTEARVGGIQSVAGPNWRRATIVEGGSLFVSETPAKLSVGCTRGRACIEGASDGSFFLASSLLLLLFVVVCLFFRHIAWKDNRRTTNGRETV